MIRIGIVGAENSHTGHIAKLCNVEHAVPGAKVVMVWGEKPEFAKKAAEFGQIPTIVAKPEQMLGHIDAVVVDHRHGKFHLKAAEPFVKARIPTFVDKPFSCDVAEGRKFLKLARQLGTPVTSFSVLPKHKSFEALVKATAKLGALSAVAMSGPCDLESIYGGVFFYGVHQVDVILRAFGYDVKEVQVNVNGPYSTATLYFKSGLIATLNLLKNRVEGFHMLVIGEKGFHSQALVSDASPYLTGVRTFVKMFKTRKEPETPEAMLAPVAVLQALAQSIEKKGARVKVPPFTL
ncbi:MAG: Gfo/Idh/MocA family protein [Planctomycetota bacterium]